MNTRKMTFTFLLIVFWGVTSFPQEKYEYTKVKDPLVEKKLEQWQGLKFGLMMHWGIYSEWGVMESWTICSEDWIKRRIKNYDEYKLKYDGLIKTFNPVDFNPLKWANAAKDAGMRYVVFTTKHHDGFCMFDTKQTDFKVTSKECPFHTNPKANITKAIFNAFRKKDFMIGAYFSKADWHSNDYWWRNFATPDRNVNYDIKKYPERWQKFVQFTHNQIDELMTGYGRIDILWLDAGWVRHYTEAQLEAIREKHNFNDYRIQNQDIDIASIVKDARAKQPGLIVVDRTVSGPFENYLTPENTVPKTVIPYPWETCMPMSNSWAYSPHAHYKSARKLIHLLVDIVSKGGNFLLDVGPDGKGDIDSTAYERLKEIGKWMKVNSEAIYYTHPVEPYEDGKVRFTQLKDGTTFAIYLVDKDENTLPSKIILTKYCPSQSSKIELLGTNGKLNWHKSGEGCEIEIPDSVKKNIRGKYAWTLKISK